MGTTTNALWIVEKEKAIKDSLPSIELVSERVHEAWIKSKLAQGVTTRKSETGEELMVPYLDLSEAAKDLDRNTVIAVYKAITNET